MVLLRSGTDGYLVAELIFASFSTCKFSPFFWNCLIAKALGKKKGEKILFSSPGLIRVHYKIVLVLQALVFVSFTSFSGHRPAQRERTRTGLIGPMQGAIPTPPGSTSATPFEQWCRFFYVPL